MQSLTLNLIISDVSCLIMSFDYPVRYLQLVNKDNSHKQCSSVLKQSFSRL